MATTTEETEVGTVIPADMLKAYPNLHLFLRKLDLEASQESTVSAVWDIIENILSAETVEDVWKAQEAGTTSGKDFLNRPFRLSLSQLDWKRSTITTPGSCPFYALMRLTDLETGGEIVVDCGGWTFVTVIGKLIDLGYFDAFEPDGAPLMMVGKSAPAGTVILVKPVHLEPTAKRRGKAA